MLQNCIDLLKHKPGLCSETCPTSSGDCNQVTNIKVEEEAEPIIFPVIKTEHEVSNIKQEEDPEPTTSELIKTEPAVSSVCVRVQCYAQCADTQSCLILCGQKTF